MDSGKVFTNKLAVPVFAILCCLLWGSAIPVVKIGYKIMELGDKDVLPKLFVAGIRFFVAGLMLLALLKFAFRLSVGIKKEYLAKVVLLGILQTFLQEMFFYIGVSNTTGAKAAVLSACDSFFVILFAHFLYKSDRINLKKILGLVTGLLGITLINFEAGFNIDFSFAGEGLLISFGIVNGISTVMAKKLTDDIHPFVLTAWQLLIGSLGLLLMGLNGEKNVLAHFGWEMAGLTLYLSFVSVAAFCIWYLLLKFNKAGVVTLYKFFIPVFGAVLSVLLLEDERFTLSIIAALALVSVGIFTVNRNGAADRSNIADENGVAG